MNNANKKTIYIHIGQAKTASTTLQHFFYMNQESFKENDVFFPLNITKESADPSFYGANARELSKSLNLLGSETAKNIWETKFLSQIKNTTCSKILLSDELLSFSHATIFNKLDLSEFNVKIIIYIRPSIEYLTSAWSQACRSSFYKNFNGKLSLDEFLENDYACIDIIYTYIDQFGKDNIILRPFEREQFFNNDLYDDFLHCLEIKNTTIFDKTDVQHPSINRNLAEITQLINLIDLPIADHKRLKDKLLKDFSPEPKVMNTLSDDLIKKITDRNADKENKLAQDLLDQETLFKSKYPSSYNKSRSPYQLTMTANEMDILKEAIKLKQGKWKKTIFDRVKIYIANHPTIRKNQFIREVHASLQKKLERN